MTNIPGGPNDLIGVGKAAEKAIEAAGQFFKALLGPAVGELGGLFADPIREYRQRRAARVLLETQQKLISEGHSPGSVPPRILVPLLDKASLESDETLHGKWVALLSNAADP